MADIECPRCGHRALSVATRCPRCGHEFSEELLRHRPPMPGRRAFRPGPAIAALLVIIAVAALLARGDREEDEAAVPPDAATEAAETLSTASGADPPRPTDSAPRPAARPPVPPAAPVPAPPTVSAPAAETVRRWATEWVNLRGSRSGRAGVVRVLRPGEPLEVDSLVRGWYRVVADGETQGYVHRRFLRSAP